MNATEETTEETTDTVPNADLKFAFDVTYGYISRITDRFKPGIDFTERGLARAASVFGWIVGIAQSGNLPLANELATDFVRNLDDLAHFGGEVDYHYTYYNGEPAVRKIPSHVVKLCDDGTAHGFALLWHRPLLDPAVLARHVEMGRQVVTFGYSDIPHGYTFNGGLIYHGPGAGETFTCNLGSRYWGVHT